LVGLTNLTDAEQNSDYERISQVRAVHLLLINNEINYAYYKFTVLCSGSKRNKAKYIVYSVFNASGI